MARINSTSITYASPTVVHSHQSVATAYAQKESPAKMPGFPYAFRSPENLTAKRTVKRGRSGATTGREGIIPEYCIRSAGAYNAFVMGSLPITGSPHWNPKKPRLPPRGWGFFFVEALKRAPTEADAYPFRWCFTAASKGSTSRLL